MRGLNLDKVSQIIPLHCAKLMVKQTKVWKRRIGLEKSGVRGWENKSIKKSMFGLMRIRLMWGEYSDEQMWEQVKQAVVDIAVFDSVRIKRKNPKSEWFIDIHYSYK